ncbi:hypothetical protein ASG96_03720 [Terrabacter sp. Soil810]|nr:hypothetical protein ASG96_03720 [Terrabacter sp. Soil810]
MGLSYRLEVSEAFRVHDGDRSVDTDVHQVDGLSRPSSACAETVRHVVGGAAVASRGDRSGVPARMTA